MIRQAALSFAALCLLASDAVWAQSPPRDPGAGPIAAILRDKAERTPVERKIGSQLLYQRRMARGLDAVPGVRTLRTGIEVDADGQVAVDVHGAVTPALTERIAAVGGRVLHASPRHGALRARLPLAELERVAELPEVRRVAPAGRAFTRKVDTSEGDVAHKADQLRAVHGVDGTGVTIGVLSDGVDSLGDRIASGDVNAGTVALPGQAGSGDEGTAMLEIISDLAPGASLLFATAFTSQASFADNIVALRMAGADVIVDDVGYFAEAVFQDDDVAEAVDDVVAAGALYVSAAGNSGNLNDGTSGTWEGDWAAGEIVDGFPAHDFGGDAQNQIVEASPSVYTLHWSDPQGGSANDYDLLITNHMGTVVFAASTDPQDGDDDPFEVIAGLPQDAGRYLVVIQFSGAPRVLHLRTNRGELEFATEGAVWGHPAARGAVAVAATGQDFAGGPGGTFDGSEPVELFSSDGPRRVHFEADGSEITPGDRSTSGGELRSTPDVTGADCVSTSTPGFGFFCGTSAAAPHVAAIAALLWELAAADGATPGDLRAVLSDTAIDIEAPGPDRDSGAGVVDALAAGDALAASCSNGLDDDGDGAIDLDDVGCDDAADASERSVALVCDNGLDDDDDGLVDLGDPGCAEPGWPLEDPACDNDVDDDLDGGVDATGLDLNGDLDFDDPGEAPPDPDCAGDAFRNSETPPGCGLGPELLPLLAGLAAARRRRTAGRAS
jgi:hypothetical protein